MAGEPSSAAPVERLGRYEVLGEIASGGMATVFLGRVTGAKGFQRLVAIKRLHPHLESEEDFVAMFLDEARLAARIRHQNVVGTLDVEDQAGLYIVMEYIEGDRLLGMLRHAAKSGERIPMPVAIRVALDTLAGLHAAHELHDDDGEPIGLVHRDVSPQNILVGVDGVARLTDFGIAKANSRLTVTRDGQLKGKIAYMAPEQTKRVEIDRRVDIFAMGIITWEMFTSKKLFTGESDVEVLNQLLFEPIPRLKDSVPGVPPAIDQAVMKALERDPTKRYGTAAEFADSLERASKILGGPANARTVAEHLRKVSADKLAKDRARFSAPGTGETGPTPSRVQRRPTNPGAAVAQETLVSADNTGSARAMRPATGPQPAVAVTPPPLPGSRVATAPYGNSAVKTTAPAAPPANARSDGGNFGPTIIDDDEDVPTSAAAKPAIAELAQPMLLTPKADPKGAPAIGPPPVSGALPSLGASRAGPNESTAMLTSVEPLPARKSLVVPIAAGVGLIAFAAVAAIFMMRSGSTPNAPPPSHAAPAQASATTVAPSRVATPPANGTAATTPTNAGLVAPPPVNTAAPTAPSQPTEPTATAPTLPSAPPPVAPTNVPANTTEPASAHHAHHGHGTAATAATATNAATPTTTATPPAHPPANPGGHHGEDDPFGNDNPYQR